MDLNSSHSYPQGGGSIRSAVLRFHELEAGHLAAWEDLCAERRDGYGPFFSPWFARAISEAHPGVFVLVQRDGAGEWTFFPFQIDGLLGRAGRAAGPVGLDLSDHCGVVCRKPRRLDFRRLLGDAGLSFFSATHLDEEQGEFGLPRGRERTGIKIAFSSAEDYWQDFKQRQSGVLGNLRNRSRKVEKTLGPLRFEWHAGEPRELERIFAVKAEQYRRTGAANVFSRAWKLDALRRLAALDSDSCRGVVSTLYAGDAWLASHFGLASRHTLHYWFPVYNESFRQLSPGNILLARLIDACSERGIRSIDMGEGVHHYKSWFGNQPYHVYDALWYTPDWGGRFNRLAVSAGWRLARLRQAAANVLQTDGRIELPNAGA